MIERQEILDVANDLSLSPDIVEKDYALGWLLDGIFTHERLAPAWVFKGGTCLKKCYFETYRFSEDLDFTVAGEAQLSTESLRASVAEVAAKLYEENGLAIRLAGHAWPPTSGATPSRELLGGAAGVLRLAGRSGRSADSTGIAHEWRGRTTPAGGWWSSATGDSRLLLP
jgi:hypothetical protein